MRRRCSCPPWLADRSARWHAAWVWASARGARVEPRAAGRPGRSRTSPYATRSSSGAGASACPAPRSSTRSPGPGWSCRDPCRRSPATARPGPRRLAVPAPRAAHAGRPRRCTSRSARARPRRDQPDAGAEQSLLVLPRTEPSAGWRGGGRAGSSLRGRRRSRGARRRRPRRLAPLPAGDPGQPHPLAGRGPRRRPDRAPPAAPTATPARWSCSTPAGRSRRRTLDAAVRAAASLTLELARRGGCGLLLPGEQRADHDRARPQRLAGRLRAPGARRRRPARPPARASAAPGGRLGAMIYVAARAPERLLPRRGRSGVGLVVPSRPPRDRAPGSPPGGCAVRAARGLGLPGLSARRPSRARDARQAGWPELGVSAGAPTLPSPPRFQRAAHAPRRDLSAQRPGGIRLITFAALGLLRRPALVAAARRPATGRLHRPGSCWPS